MTAKQSVFACIKKAESFYKRRFSMPSVRFELQGKAAGLVYPKHNVIRFNPILLAENTQHFLIQTVPHEVAHLVTYAVFGPGIRPHGKEWQFTMTEVFGLRPDRCHSYDTCNSVARTMTYYTYSCLCGKNHRLSAIRHKRFLRREVEYRCRNCKSILVPTRVKPAQETRERS